MQTHVSLGLNALVQQTLLLVCALQTPLRYDTKQALWLYVTGAQVYSLLSVPAMLPACNKSGPCL